MAEAENVDIELNEDDEGGQLFEHHSIMVDKGQQYLRIDKFLMDRLANVTRNKLQDAIEKGYVLVNEGVVKANYKVKPLDVIKIYMPEPKRLDEIIPEAIPLNIVYEDEHVLLVNKPPGMVVHPAYQNWSGTLINALAYHFQNLPSRKNGDGHAGLCHRIDKDTSGLLVIAKTEIAMEKLSKQFHDHTIERTYLALVWGSFDHPTGTIKTRLARSLQDRRVVTTFPLEGEHGKIAITHYKVLESYQYVTLIQCNLETGRTHQIRAHMRSIGHPIFGDMTYGGDQIVKGTVFSKYKQFVENCFKIIPRQALHAKSLGFIHPATNQWMQFESDLPLDFKMVLKKWENYVQFTVKEEE